MSKELWFVSRQGQEIQLFPKANNPLKPNQTSTGTVIFSSGA
jgi:hypothetical protein